MFASGLFRVRRGGEEERGRRRERPEWNNTGSSRTKWTLFAARVVANTSLYTSKGCLFVFLLISVPTFLGSFPNFLELALFYLMVLTYFCMFWIWPSKHLLVAIDEMEPRNFLPWILSALVHSVIIYGLYGVHGALDLDTPRGADQLAPLLASIALIFLPQVVVWIAWIEVARERQRQTEEGQQQGEEDALVQEGLGVSRMPVGCEEPPPAYSDVVTEHEVSCTRNSNEEERGPPPPYSEIDLEKA